MAPTPSTRTDQAEEEEDDYLTMTFDDHSSTTSTTSKAAKPSLTQLHAQRTSRAETAGRPKSKSELAEEAERKRNQALSSSLFQSLQLGAATNKAAAMMAKMGYTPGSTLGPTSSDVKNGLLEPIGLEMKSDRGGLGADAEKKRKIREEVERVAGEEKRRKVDEVEYRERVVREREERRMEGQLMGARKVAEGLEEEDQLAGQVGDGTDNSTSTAQDQRRKTTQRRLRDVNVLWRGMVRAREIAERDKRLRNELIYSSARPRYLPGYEDTEADADDKLALHPDRVNQEVVDDADLDEDDSELDGFEALGVAEKLEKVIAYLRERWHYCFWCKYRYPDEEMEGCPGLSEDEHG